MLAPSKSRKQDPWERAAPLIEIISGMFHEMVYGLWYGAMPSGPLMIVTIGIYFAIYFHWDHWTIKQLGLGELYPQNWSLFKTYQFLFCAAPFLIWGLKETLIRKRMSRKLKEAFFNAGLQNRMGDTPSFTSDYPCDEVTRALNIKNVGLPVSQYQKTKEYIEASLSIYIDEFQENRQKGRVSMIYSTVPMPSLFDLPRTLELKKSEFLVGTTRSKDIRSVLDEVPHLLVAGQTGGGKSTFLRQFITSLYMGDPNCRFILIDLKGGLEFQLFEDLPRVVVPATASSSINLLSEFSLLIENRMREFKKVRAKDIPSYEAITRTAMERVIIVVDEAAEMFLKGVHSNQDDVNVARRILSQIARQGRSIGIHLVVATQRPDVKALDPQVKANLTGVICFQMVNDASSISVLGTGRATDLPGIPGRAIWKCGAEMIEVQTPFLSVQRAEELLEKYSKQKTRSEKQSMASVKVPRLNPEDSFPES